MIKCPLREQAGPPILKDFYTARKLTPSLKGNRPKDGLGNT